MEPHWSLGELDRLVRSHLDPQGGDRLFHLMICYDCQDRLRAMHPEEGPGVLARLLGSEEPLPPEADDAELRASLGCLLESWRPKIDQALEEIHAAGPRLDQLLALPRERRKLLAENSRRFRNLGLVALLLEETPKTWRHDVLEAQSLADLALAILPRLCRNTYRAHVLNDFFARAWAYYGNCRRILSDLPEADRAFQKAHVYLHQGSGEPLDGARIFDLESSLRRDQRRFDEAGALLEVALAIYRSLGDPWNEAKITIQHAILLQEIGETRRARALLSTLCDRFTPEAIGENNYLCASHNLAIYLVDEGLAATARDRVPAIRHLAESHGSPLQLLRVDWLEGLIAGSLGESREAERKLLYVRRRFAEEDIGYDAALVSLDLAILYLEDRRMDEVRELAAELVPLFLAQDVQREALAALVTFQRAVESETATAEMGRQIARRLRHSSSRPIPSPVTH